MKILQTGGTMSDSNIYLIKDKKTALIDTGTGGFGSEVVGELKEHLAKKKLDLILLTHEHYDHIGGVVEIQEKLGGTIHAHPYTAEALEGGKNMVTGAPMFGKMQKKIKGIKTLEEKQTIDLGSSELEVIYTPGHSKGSASFYNWKDKILFPGDVVFTQGGVGRWDLPGGDLKLLTRSIKGFLEYDLIGLYPGHGPYTEKYGHSHIEQALESLKMYSRFG